MNSLSVGAGRIPVLDGLRGIAIALVLIHHSPELSWPKEWMGSIEWKVYWHLSKSLWVGVDIFFVLSGFLITSILINTKGTDNYYVGFYGRRMLRILPMFLLVLLIVSAILYLRGGIQLGQFLMLLFSLGNWLVIGDNEIAPLSHFWSLAIEDQFYILWPAVVLLVEPRKVARICIALIISAAMFRVLVALGDYSAYVNYKITPTRWDGLAYGALLACLPFCPDIEQFVRKYLRGGIAIAALLVFLVFVAEGGGLYGFSNVSIVLGLPFVELLAFGLLYYVLTRDFLRRFLTTSLLQWLGRYSYSIYLLHVPFLFFGVYLSELSPNTTIGFWISTICYFGASLMVARISWALVEGPCLMFRPLFRARGTTNQ